MRPQRGSGVGYVRTVFAGAAVLGLATLSACSVSEPSQSRPEAAPVVGASASTSVATSVAGEPLASQMPLTAPKGSLFDKAVYARKARSKPSAGGVTLRSTGRGPLAGKTVVIDPGHNGRSEPRINNRKVPDGRGGTKACNTTGTSTNAGYAEHRHNWSVATLTAERLQKLGAQVVLTRPDNAGAGPCVDERAAIGNRVKADLVVSIHADGAAARARGFHMIRSTGMAGGSPIEKRSAEAATVLRDAYAKRTGLPRSTYLGKGTGITPRPDIAGLNLSRVPAVMLEAGNMRNAAEARLLSNASFHAKEADAVVDGIRAFLRR